MHLFALDVQGFNLCSTEEVIEFYAKEVTVTNGRQTGHYMLKPQMQFSRLTKYNKICVTEAEKVHGLKYSSGYIENHKINEILAKALTYCDILYIKG